MNMKRTCRFVAGVLVAVAALGAGGGQGTEQTDPVAFLMLGSLLVGVAKLCFRDSDESREPNA